MCWADGKARWNSDCSIFARRRSSDGGNVYNYDEIYDSICHALHGRCAQS